jgi:prepilin-type N-terminal cleavage/methylation domain-containing protein
MKNKFAKIAGAARNAFTFIEVLIALVIVSISLLALIRLHLIRIRMTETAEITSQAVFLANQKLSEMLALAYPEEGIDSGIVELNALRLNWRTEVTNIEPYHPGGLDIAGLRRILVDVSWQQGISRKHLQMSTYVADSGLGLPLREKLP